MSTPDTKHGPAPGYSRWTQPDADEETDPRAQFIDKLMRKFRGESEPAPPAAAPTSHPAIFQCDRGPSRGPCRCGCGREVFSIEPRAIYISRPHKQAHYRQLAAAKRAKLPKPEPKPRKQCSECPSIIPTTASNNSHTCSAKCSRARDKRRRAEHEEKLRRERNEQVDSSKQ